jgi:hypothetical protein
VRDRTEVLPVEFPSELADAAFLAGNEAAWRPAVAARVVEWLGSHGYAVLGTELWVIRDGAIHSLPIGQTKMPEVHGNVVNRQADEPWTAFVNRPASETVDYLRSFKSGEIVEPGDLHFNVTWVPFRYIFRLRQSRTKIARLRQRLSLGAMGH